MKFTLRERLALRLYGYIPTTDTGKFIVRCHRCHTIYIDIIHQLYPKSHFECPRCGDHNEAPPEYIHTTRVNLIT